jgi:galactofuranosylgalactofuranosylrhamnosyl-N-acetylglucosaminyl-diphospho-decaprenol beta-1,5/1,6-galactofuranosyltransferase
MEYGLRLQKLGVATVAMPGIAVWHEPFYVKAGGWQTYYDFRNRFILASAYPERFRLETPSFMLLIMMKALAVHDYQEAALIQMAVEDFLKGPALFDEESSVKIHERVAALNKRFQPLSVDGNKKYKGPKLRENPKKRLRRTLKIVRRLLAVLLSGRRKAEADLLFMDRDVHIGNIGVYAYVKTNGIRSFHLQYSPDRESLKYLLKGCMSAYLRYRSHSRETAKKWNEDLPRFRKTAWWGSIFGQK